MRETGLSKGDGLVCGQQVVGSDPRGRVCERLRVIHRKNYECMFTHDKVSSLGRLGGRRGTRKYPSKVKGAQMANLHFGVAATGGWMLIPQFLMQFYDKREKISYVIRLNVDCSGALSGES